MAGVRGDEDMLPESGPARRSGGVVWLVVAALAAIAVVWSMTRRSPHRIAAPIMSAVPEAAPPTPTPEPEPAPAVAPAVAPRAPERPLTDSTQAEMARVIREGRTGLKACYQRALVRDPTLVHARLNVRLTIAASGRVDAVNITGPAAFRPLEPCLGRAINGWTFPSAPAPYKTEFPLVLQGTQ